MTKCNNEFKHLLKSKWSSACDWRMNNGNVEFALDSSYGLQWFPLYNAPQTVEMFVTKYLSMGGSLND